MCGATRVGGVGLEERSQERSLKVFHHQRGSSMDECEGKQERKVERFTFLQAADLHASGRE